MNKISGTETEIFGVFGWRGIWSKFQDKFVRHSPLNFVNISNE